MKLKLKRDTFNEKSTLGKLYVDGEYFCETIEDTDRHLEDGGEKVYGKTSIPRGTYKVTVTMSNRFKKELPLLLDVPQFSGVRIHPGNTAEDTEGCILVGEKREGEFITNSKATFKKLFPLIKEAGDDCTIEIT